MVRARHGAHTHKQQMNEQENNKRSQTIQYSKSTRVKQFCIAGFRVYAQPQFD